MPPVYVLKQLYKDEGTVQQLACYNASCWHRQHFANLPITCPVLELPGLGNPWLMKPEWEELL